MQTNPKTYRKKKTILLMLFDANPMRSFSVCISLSVFLLWLAAVCLFVSVYLCTCACVKALVCICVWVLVSMDKKFSGWQVVSVRSIVSTNIHRLYTSCSKTNFDCISHHLGFLLVWFGLHFHRRVFSVCVQCARRVYTAYARTHTKRHQYTTRQWQSNVNRRESWATLDTYRTGV